MSLELINRNPDLKKLKNEGYALEIKDNYLLVREIPYVNSRCQIEYGILVSDLTSMAGDKTVGPVSRHVAYFIGDFPCNSDGTPIKGIHSGSQEQQLTNDLVVNHSFSRRPSNGYVDYYEKMTTYTAIIVSQAQDIDGSVTAKPFKSISSDNKETVFNYLDTNSSRGKINMISSKLENQKLAIIGVGGTGAYILDFVAKTPVQEIHLFDGDILMNHNAFRSPGAPSAEKLREINKKTDYFGEIYSNIRKNIYSHNYYINTSNVNELSEIDFVFLCLDKGGIKKLIIEYLLENNVPFIDVGMGVNMVDDYLIGHVRVTTGTTEKQDHIKSRISFSEVGAPNDYSTNIQIAELNALNATLAVIKWKKLFGFYQDLGNEFNTTYSINDGKLFNDDYIA